MVLHGAMEVATISVSNPPLKRENLLKPQQVNVFHDMNNPTIHSNVHAVKIPATVHVPFRMMQSWTAKKRFVHEQVKQYLKNT